LSLDHSVPPPPPAITSLRQANELISSEANVSSHLNLFVLKDIHTAHILLLIYILPHHFLS
jgi:hypothetical protein